jgi:hypothetical protein
MVAKQQTFMATTHAKVSRKEPSGRFLDSFGRPASAVRMCFSRSLLGLAPGFTRGCLRLLQV